MQPLASYLADRRLRILNSPSPPHTDRSAPSPFLPHLRPLHPLPYQEIHMPLQKFQIPLHLCLHLLISCDPLFCFLSPHCRLISPVPMFRMPSHPPTVRDLSSDSLPPAVPLPSETDPDPGNLLSSRLKLAAYRLNTAVLSSSAAAREFFSGFFHRSQRLFDLLPFFFQVCAQPVHPPRQESYRVRNPPLFFTCSASFRSPLPDTSKLQGGGTSYSQRFPPPAISHPHPPFMCYSGEYYVFRLAGYIFACSR